MADRNANLQDVFLNHVRKEKASVTVFLVNGVKLTGRITWFDNFCVLLSRDPRTPGGARNAVSQLVYKHAISTIMPDEPVKLFDEGDED